jgi:large subunit ribosomal protein L1
MKKGKKYIEKAKKVDREKLYSPEDAIVLLKELKNEKFDETVEIHFNLGIDPRHSDQQLRGTMVLPNGTGKDVVVLVLAQGEKVSEAKEAGADYVGCEEYIEKIQKGWFEFDLVIATPDVMSKVGRLGRQLGSKGLMPNPKTGTVTMNVADAVKEFKAGKVEYRNDKTGIIHLILGKTSFDNTRLQENFLAVYDAILKAKPVKSKGVYMRSVSICSTMSPGIFIEPMKIKWKD